MAELCGIRRKPQTQFTVHWPQTYGEIQTMNELAVVVQTQLQKQKHIRKEIEQQKI